MPEAIEPEVVDPPEEIMEPEQDQVQDLSLGVRQSTRVSTNTPRYNPSTGKDYHTRGRTLIRNVPSYAQAMKELALKEFIHNLHVNDMLKNKSLEYGVEKGEIIARMIHDFRENI